MTIRARSAARMLLVSSLLGCAVTPSPGPPTPIGTIPFDLAGGFILIRAIVNNDSATLTLAAGSQGVLLDRRFARDTSDRGLAGRLQLPGGVLLRDYRVWYQALDRLSEADGRRLDGFLGDDFLGRLTMEIDFAARVIRLYEPTTYAYTGAGTSLPLEYAGAVPTVRALINVGDSQPVEARLILGTRSAHACIVLDQGFVDRHRLAERLRPTVEGPFLRSPTRGLRITVGRVPSIAFASLTLDRPTVFLRRDGEWNAMFDGAIGNALWQGTRLILDYARRRAIIEVDSSFGRDCGFDRSGLVLSSHAPRFRSVTVDYVVPGSPAAQAHLRVGDEVVTFEGRPVADLDLEDIRGALGMEGLVRRLQVVRGRDTMTASFKLRDLF